MKAGEQDWQPNTTFIPKIKIVQLRINYGEVDLARQMRSMGENETKQKRFGNFRMAMYKH